MDMMMRLERVISRDYPVLVAAIGAGENALAAMEQAQEQRFTAALGTFKPKPVTADEENRLPRTFNLKAARRDWDEFKSAADDHIARELAEFVPLARRVIAGQAGNSHLMIQLNIELDAEHQALRALAAKLRTHALSIEPVRDALNGAITALQEHIRVHDMELTPQLNRGTNPGADRRDTEDRYRHSSSIKASSRPAPSREEEPKEGLLNRWFSLIRKQR